MAKDNVDLILEIGELASLFERNQSLPDFLQKTIATIAFRMRAAVCSIYLYESDRQELVLSANQGLSSGAVGEVRMSINEGLIGLALRELRTINEGRASEHPDFKMVPNLEEELFHAFLAVPILRGLKRVGVLVVQDPEPNYFSEHDEKALRAIGAQIASVIENAGLLMRFHELEKAEQNPESRPVPPQSLPTFIHGTSAANGIALGSTFVLGSEDYDIFISTAEDEEEPLTLEDFQGALFKTERQLQGLQRKVDESLEDVASFIFSVQLLVLKDPEFYGKMEKLITDGVDPERAVTDVVNDFIHLFEKFQGERHREKTQDLKDLGHRLLANLREEDEEHVDYTGQVVISQDLLPSEIVKLCVQNVEGLVVTQGTVVSHIAIIARSLQVPLVFVENRRLLNVPDGTPIILDAIIGNIHLDPTAEVLDRFRKQQSAFNDSLEHAVDLRDTTSTRDGTRIRILANINLLSDIKVANQLKAEGVGLYRSEMPFLVRSEFPSEVEQLRIYSRLTDGMEGKEVVFRTLDIGGDKVLPYHSQQEDNPFMGLRAIRFSLRNKMIFSAQIRALLRAGAKRIMFPFISSVDDFLDAQDVVNDCIAELEGGDQPFNRTPELGAMVELPAAVEIAEELAAEAKFLSIGTNDLIQYMLAVDRTNENVSNFYVPYHPAVLRALNKIVLAATKADIDLSVCGDLAHDERMIPFLLGIGITKISIDPRALPRVQKRIMGLHIGDCTKVARKMLSYGKVSDIREFLDSHDNI